MVWNTDGLTTVEKNMLWIESQVYKNYGLKMQAVFDLTRLPPVEYFAKLAALVRRPEAQRWDPITCRRVPDLEEKRRRARTVGFDA